MELHQLIRETTDTYILKCIKSEMVWRKGQGNNKLSLTYPNLKKIRFFKFPIWFGIVPLKRFLSVTSWFWLHKFVREMSDEFIFWSVSSQKWRSESDSKIVIWFFRIVKGEFKFTDLRKCKYWRFPIMPRWLGIKELKALPPVGVWV